MLSLNKMKKVILIFLCLTIAGGTQGQDSGNNLLSKEKIIKVFDSSQDFRGIQFKNDEVGQCEFVILINSIVKKNVQFENDIELISIEGRKTCFMSETYIFDMGVISYIEIVKIKIKQKKAVMNFFLFEKKGFSKKILKKGKVSIKL